MAKKSTKRKPTRKRRSFFEPESKVLAEWLADQNDLGVSLQLIIVDAIRNYGEGDVIQAFLKARETLPGEVPVTTASSEAVKQVSLFAEAKLKAEAKGKSKPKAQAVVEPEPRPDAELPVDDLPVEPKIETPAKPEPAKPEPKASEPKAEYDPLDIMFQDIGSSMNN